jgi:hypothetical protein
MGEMKRAIAYEERQGQIRYLFTHGIARSRLYMLPIPFVLS